MQKPFVGHTQKETEKEGKIYRRRCNAVSKHRIKQWRFNMAVITRDKTRLEGLIDRRLDDDTEDTGEVRAAAKQYYMGLVQEDMELNEGMTPDGSLDSNELAMIGFLAGYGVCLRSHGGK